MFSLKRWLPSRQEEVFPVFIFGLVLLSNALAQKVAEIASISSFLNDVGVPQFLIVLTVSSFISIATTGILSLLIDRFTRIHLICGVTVLLGISFACLRFLFLIDAPNWLNYSFFYLLADQQFTCFPLIFWVLANDTFEMSQAKRLFPLIASFGFWGNLIGIGIASLSPPILTALGIPLEEVLTLIIFIYCFIFLLIWMGLRRFSVRQTRQKLNTFWETFSEGWEFIQEVPVFRYLALTGLAVITCENIIDFRFFVVSEAFFQNTGTYQTFFGLFTLARMIAYISLQTFLIPKIIKSVDLKNIFMVLPCASLLGVLSAIAIPGIGGGITAVSLQKIPQYTLDDVAKKSFQGLVPEEKRGRVSAFMDSYLVAGGAILGAVLTGATLLISQQLRLIQAFYLYLGIALIVAAVAIVGSMRLRTVYDSSLLNWRLKRRKRGSILDKLDF